MIINTLRLDDVDYEIEDLPDQTRGKVERVQALQAQIDALNLQAQELAIVAQAYVNTIKAELAAEGGDDEAEDAA